MDLRRRILRQNGASMIGVALLISLLVLVAYPALRPLGLKVATPYCQVNATMDEPAPGHERWVPFQDPSPRDPVMCCNAGEWECLTVQECGEPEFMTSCEGPGGWEP